MTLVLPRKGTLGVNDKQPFVYLKCGHVHGQHQWGQSNDNDGRTCPLCLTVSIAPDNVLFFLLFFFFFFFKKFGPSCSKLMISLVNRLLKL